MSKVNDTQMNVPLYDTLKNIGVSEEDARKVAMEPKNHNLRLIEINNSIQGVYSPIDHSNKELRNHTDSSTRTLRNYMKLQKLELETKVIELVHESTKTITIRLLIGLWIFTMLMVGILGFARSVPAMIPM